MNGNGGEPDPLAQLAAGAVDLGGMPALAVRRQLIVSPLQTEADAIAADQLEISFLDTEGGEPIARTFRIGAGGIEQLRAALEALEGLDGSGAPDG